MVVWNEDETDEEEKEEELTFHRYILDSKP